MTKNGQTYLNKSAAFAANFFKQVHPPSPIGGAIFHEIERELVNGVITNSLLRFSV